MKYLMLRRFILVCFLFSACHLCVKGHSHSHHHSHDHDEPPSFKYSKQANADFQPQRTPESKAAPRNDLMLWVEAIGSTLLISAAPFVILFFIPLNNRIEHEPRLKVLLSFASGGLLGDAFLHLIPHALLAQSHGGSHSHSHSHSHGESDVAGHDLSIGLGVLAGIVVFLMVEKFVRIVKGGHGHSHSVPGKPEEADAKEADKCAEGDASDDMEIEREDDKEEECDKEGVSSDIKEEEVSDGTGDIKVAGYLNLAADFTHNFTDGLAIGASFLAGRGVGLITTVTILLHEVPHEIGDFAILIQSGCSKRKAIMLQAVTAIGALAGTSMSLLAEGIDERISRLILPFTAGGFIYIATVSVIPELLEDTKFWQSVKEVFALLAGVLMMVIIAQYE